MKKSTISTIYDILTSVDFEGKTEVMTDLYNEIHRNDNKRDAAAVEYAAALPVVLSVFEQTDVPVTASEIYEAIGGNLPDGFTKGRMQYGLSKVWTDRIETIPGKPNTYVLRK